MPCPRFPTTLSWRRRFAPRSRKGCPPCRRDCSPWRPRSATADRARPLNRGKWPRCSANAHTIKGSARLLGVDRMVRIAHAAEDLLGAVRDGRVPLRPELVDLLLAACDGLARTGPGADPDLPDAQVEALVSTLRSFAPSSSGAAFRRAAPVPRQRATRSVRRCRLTKLSRPPPPPLQRTRPPPPRTSRRPGPSPLRSPPPRCRTSPPPPRAHRRRR